MERPALTLVRAIWISVALILSGTVPATAGARTYRLCDLYRNALARADRIQISRDDLAVAEQTREKALSVLKPSISAETSYRDYTREEILYGSVIQPDWEGAYGIKAGQSFTLNGRELTALRIAETDIERSRYDLDAVREGYLLEVATAFYQVARAGKALDIAEANVRRLETHRSAVERKLRLAEVPKTERFRTEAELAKAAADRIQAENTLRLARAALVRVAGIEGDFQILEESGSGPDPAETDLQAIRATASENRAELKSLTLQERIANDRIAYAKGAYWPTVGIEGGWQRYDRSPRPLLDESVYVGMSLEFPFYDGGLRNAEVREARLRQRQAAHARADTARAVALEVETAWSELSTQRGVIASREAQRRYAGENFAAVQRLFEHGLANSVDVMDANTLLLTAEREVADARYGLRTALLKLKRAEGVFLKSVEQELSRTAPEKQPSEAAAAP